MEERKEPTPKKLSERELYERAGVEVSKDYFSYTLEEFNKEMENSETFRKYLLDEEVFINTIRAHKNDATVEPWHKMMIAVEMVNQERIRRIFLR